MPRAIFAGCARSCAKYLPGVLANIDALAATYDDFAVVIVENDSTDDTRALLQAWAADRPQVRLILLDDLETQHPLRTDRIAYGRNLCLSFAREPGFVDFEDLVLLDFDEVNSRPLDIAAFSAARAWLWGHRDRRAVFANPQPFYYDVWALRHPGWSPDDCWEQVRASQGTLSLLEAKRRHIFARQISIPADSEPILVESAFGGLGIYRRATALHANYQGLDEAGAEICEHVAFNRAVAGRAGKMAIFPALTNSGPGRHILGVIKGGKLIALDQDGASCTLIGTRDHPLETYRAEHPLYDRRLPQLARLISDQAPHATFIDVGANIGDTIALARLAGATMPAIAIEASLTYCKFLWANMLRTPDLISDVRIAWGYVGAAGAEAEVRLGAGTGSAAGTGDGAVTEKAPALALDRVARTLDVALVKTDTDGFDQDVLASELPFLKAKHPIVWAEAQTECAADEQKWRRLLARMQGEWPNMILFDNFGFAIAAGSTARLADQAVSMMAYARRQRRESGSQGIRPSFYYLDLALFPKRFDTVYGAFVEALPELHD